MSKRFWIALAVVIVSVAVVSGVVGGVWEIVDSLLVLGFGVYCLLVVYRRVGPADACSPFIQRAIWVGAT
jgi:hypothetical protein